MVNENNSRWRGLLRRHETPSSHVLEVLDPPGVAGLDPTASIDLWRHVQNLPRQQRSAVVLRYYEGPDRGTRTGDPPGRSVAWDVSTGTRRPVDGTLQLVNAARGTALVPAAQQPGSDAVVHGAAGPRLRAGRSGDSAGRWSSAPSRRTATTCSPPAYIGRPRRVGAEPGPHLPLRRARRGPHERRRDRARRNGGRRDGCRLHPSPTGWAPTTDHGAGARPRRAAAASSCARLDGTCTVVAPEHERDNPDIPEGDDPSSWPTTDRGR